MDCRQNFFRNIPFKFCYKRYNRFKKLRKTNNSINIHRLVNKISEVAIKTSYYLCTQKYSEWSDPISKFWMT